MAGEAVTDKAEAVEKTCFVIMPISDTEAYAPGHFKRVYQHLIQPACKAAGFNPIRADDVAQTNYIVVDILRRIIESDMVLCDLSSRNPNVLFELGIRQAYDKPVTLIMDGITDKVFDISGLRYTKYSDGLRVDTAEADKVEIEKALRETATATAGEVNSLVRLLGVTRAATPQPVPLSEHDSLILNSLQDISGRITDLEKRLAPRPASLGSSSSVIDSSRYISVGESVELSNLPTYISGAVSLSQPENRTPPRKHALSPLEISVLDAIAKNGIDGRDEIATALGISGRQYDDACASALRKLGTDDVREAIYRAKRLGHIR